MLAEIRQIFRIIRKYSHIVLHHFKSRRNDSKYGLRASGDETKLISLIAFVCAPTTLWARIKVKTMGEKNVCMFENSANNK